MLRLNLIVLFCAVLLVSACATPSDRPTVAPDSGETVASGPDVASVPVAAASEQDDPLVCKRIVQTGTRVAQRICRRQSEIDASQRGAQDMLGEAQKRGTQANETQQ